LIQEEASKERTGEVQAIVPVSVSAFLLNEKRADINEIESRSRVRIVIVASPYLDTPHFEVRRLRDDEVDQTARLSFDIDMPSPSEPATAMTSDAPPSAPEALVRGVTPDAPAPEAPAKSETAAANKPSTKRDADRRRKDSSPGLLARIWAMLFGSSEPESKPKQRGRRGGEQNRNRSRSRSGDRRRQNQGGNEEQNRRGDRGNRRGQDKEQPPRDDSLDSGDVTDPQLTADAGDNAGEDQPKRARRRRGRRGGQRRAENRPADATESEAISDAEEAATDTLETAPRRRPPEKRNEGRRRRERVSASQDEGLANDTAIDSISSPETSLEPVAAEVASSEALSMAFGESPEDAREQQTSEAASESETLTQHTGESGQTDTVAPTNATDNISAGDLPAEQSKQEQRSSGEKLGDVIGALVANTGGLTETGRAVNDPRIMPKPIKETILQTEQLQLFALPEAPPVSVINRDVPRASNDPRGPRAALSRGE